MFRFMYIAFVIAFIGSVISSDDLTRIEQTEINLFLAELVDIESTYKESIDELTLEDLLEQVTFHESNHLLEKALAEKLQAGQYTISGDVISCDGVNLLKYYDVDALVKVVCPNIEALSIGNDNKDQLELWGKCLESSAAKPKHFQLSMPLDQHFYEMYKTHLVLARLTNLKTLSLSDYVDQVDKSIFPSESLNLTNCNVEGIDGDDAPESVVIDSPWTENVDDILTSLEGISSPAQTFINPPTSLWDMTENLEVVKCFRKLSLRNQKEFFFFENVQNEGLVSAGNTVRIIPMLEYLTPLLDHYTFQHLYIDIDDFEKLIDFEGLKKISHLTIATPTEQMFDSLEKFFMDNLENDIFEIELKSNSISRPAKYVYVDYAKEFAHLNILCFNSIQENTINYMVLDINSNDHVNLCQRHLDDLEESYLKFLKINMNHSNWKLWITNKSQWSAFSAYTIHINTKEVEIISSQIEAGYGYQKNCVEAIFKEDITSEDQMKDAIGAIITTGEYYRIIFAAAMNEGFIGYFVPIFAEFKECTELEISVIDGGEELFNYFAENRQKLEESFDELQITRVRVIVHKTMDNYDNLCMIGAVFSFVDFIILKFEAETKIINNAIYASLNKLNANTHGHDEWTLLKLNRCTRTFVLSRKKQLNSEVEEFLERSVSLQAKSNEIIASKKITYEEIQSLRVATIGH